MFDQNLNVRKIPGTSEIQRSEFKYTLSNVACFIWLVPISPW